MTTTSTPPPALPVGPRHDHGSHPARRDRWYTRRWLQVPVAALVAFVVGLGVGGAPAEAEPADDAQAEATSQIDELESQVDEFESELEERSTEVNDLRQDLADAESSAVAALDRARRTAARETRAAVGRAKTVLRARAAQRQRAAVAAAVAAAEARAGASAPAPAAPADAGTDPRFGACYEANDAGYGNYVQGVDPEYDWYDDRDGDGQVCET